MVSSSLWKIHRVAWPHGNFSTVHNCLQQSMAASGLSSVYYQQCCRTKC